MSRLSKIYFLFVYQALNLRNYDVIECITSTNCTSERPLCWNGQCHPGKNFENPILCLSVSVIICCRIYIVLLTMIYHHILSGVRCAEYGYALNCPSCHMTYGEQGSCGKDCVILNNDFSKKQDLATEQCIRRGKYE